MRSRGAHDRWSPGLLVACGKEGVLLTLTPCYRFFCPVFLGAHPALATQIHPLWGLNSDFSDKHRSPPPPPTSHRSRSRAQHIAYNSSCIWSSNNIIGLLERSRSLLTSHSITFSIILKTNCFRIRNGMMTVLRRY